MKPGVSIKDVFEGQSAEILSVGLRLRKMVRENMPDFFEVGYHGALGYSPTGRSHDRIVYILPARDHVTLGFFFGTHLSDSKHLLVGEGRRMRHVKVSTLQEAENPALGDLVREAYEDATKSLVSIRKGSSSSKRRRSASREKND